MGRLANNISNPEHKKIVNLAESYLADAYALVNPLGELDQEKASKISFCLHNCTKQLNKLQSSDVEIQTARGQRIVLSQIKQIEGICEGIAYKRNKQGIQLIEEGLSNPLAQDPVSYYILHHLHLYEGKKEPAILALHKAIELAPDEIDYQKALNELEDVDKTSIFFGSDKGRTAINVAGTVGIGAVKATGWVLEKSAKTVFNLMFKR